MSTRSQVKVTDGRESITLYHHTDGYPQYIVPIIARAEKLAGNDWTASRAGKVAGYLCCIDPGVFEPEASHELHGDIKFYYVLTVGKGTWKLKTCTATCPDFDSPVKLRTLHRSQGLDKLSAKYPDKWTRTDGFKRLQGLQVGMNS